MGAVGNHGKLESIRILVQEMVLSMDSAIQRQEACVQLYGVSHFSALLALKRGQHQEMAAIIGLLHDYYFYKTGIQEIPGPNSAETVRPLLRDLHIFSQAEQTTILQAIFNRDDRERVHEPYDEILKDAYVLQSYFHNRNVVLKQQDADRVQHVFHELALLGECPIEMLNPKKLAVKTIDKRSKLADIAEELGRDRFIGVPGEPRYREICKYWPDQNIHHVLQSNWCAAFVYHCCMQAGFILPIRYPNGNHRLAGVGALLEWAQLPEHGFFYADMQNDFTPQRGDIVVYEKLLTNNSHDHTGIVLACNDKEILVAEGNTNNQNYSSVLYRDRWSSILGYIRIDNNYQYRFEGDYNPIL